MMPNLQAPRIITIPIPSEDAENRQCEVLLNRVLKLADIKDQRSYSLQQGARIIWNRQPLFIDGTTM
jgi:hypothetical protein